MVYCRTVPMIDRLPLYLIALAILGLIAVGHRIVAILREILEELERHRDN